MESPKLRRRAVKELAKGHTANQYGWGPFSLIHSLLLIKCLLHRRPWEAKLQRQSLPALLLVSLLEQTKFRVNGSGSELQVLSKPPWDPGQAIPGVDNWDMLREMVLVLQTPQGQKRGILAKAERSCTFSLCLMQAQTYRLARNLENEFNSFLCLWERLHLHCSLPESFSQGTSLI